MSSAKPPFPAMLWQYLGMLWQKYSLCMVLHDHHKVQANFETDCEDAEIVYYLVNTPNIGST